jgi:CRISPR-associated protein Csm1
MDSTVLKIALAAFFHDIGKFADRNALNISDEYTRNHADLYQPFNQNHHTHPHAVYTAAFIEQMHDLLPEELNSSGWGQGDAFINLAAGHHRPETPLQWVIAVADRVSSGWDRESFDASYNYQVTWKDYKRTRLYPIFEQLAVDKEQSQGGPSSYFYPLTSLSPQSLFPCRKSDDKASSASPEKEYLNLFDEFKEALATLLHRRENLELWFEHFDTLMMMFTSAIPSARAGKVIPDVSLYDHCRITASLAVAIYLYHLENDTLSVEAVKNYADDKFLIINADFYGIQNFILSEHGDTRKKRSKLLRGRSFAVSLYSELAADFLCRELGLPFSSVALNAAGKFTIIAPNTPGAADVVNSVEAHVNDWLIGISHGENSMGFSCQKASAQDLVKGNFLSLWERMGQAMEEKKLARLDLNRHGGSFPDFLDGFNNDLQRPLCPFCGKRPSLSRVENSQYVGEGESSCAICRDHIFLGTNLVKRPRLAITTADTKAKENANQLMEPIYGRYQVSFQEGDLSQWAEKGTLLKYWDLSVASERQDQASRITIKMINGYVPVYTDADNYDPRILAGRKSETRKLELISQIVIDDPKTFGHIAAAALQVADTQAIRGLEALGVLKADIDELGLLMSCGLKPESFTVSRLATLSRQLHFFFSLYLPHLLETDQRFRNIYTVFAGGDDLFLIGPWNHILDLVRVLKKSFATYVCHNPAIHFSAGISLHKPNTPMDFVAEAAEEALQEAKDSGRDRLTVFGETVPWQAVDQLQEVKETLEGWLEQEWINHAMLYRLNEFLQMAGIEQRVITQGEVHLDDMACTKWRSLLAYSVERNAARHLKDEQRRGAVEQVSASCAQWLTTYGSTLKIPLWELLYNLR